VPSAGALLCGLLVGGECTLKSSLFDEPAPTLLPTVLTGDGLAGGKRAVTSVRAITASNATHPVASTRSTYSAARS